MFVFQTRTRQIFCFFRFINCCFRHNFLIIQVAHLNRCRSFWQSPNLSRKFTPSASNAGARRIIRSALFNPKHKSKSALPTNTKHAVANALSPTPIRRRFGFIPLKIEAKILARENYLLHNRFFAVLLPFH